MNKNVKKNNENVSKINHFKGDLLKFYREKKNFKTQRDLAFAIESTTPLRISSQSIRNHELGFNEPKMSVVMVYSKILGVEISKFYERNDYENNVSIHE